MRNHIVFFSGGKSSFTVAHLVKKKYPDDNIVLYFTDTLWEDEDLHRFIHEASAKLQLPMLYHALGLDPVQLMFKQKAVYNSRIGNCSTILKMGVAADFLKRNIEPPKSEWHNKEYLKVELDPSASDFAENTTLYFGIGWEEMHREAAIKKNWLPFKVEMPLIDEVIDNQDVLDLYNIRQPRLYEYGFTHNNCKGRCVKAGQGHFINLLQQMPELFEETMAYEHHMSKYVATNHYLRNQKYYPETEQIDDDALEIMLSELDDAYRDYFNGEADKPGIYVHPSISAAPFEVDKMVVDRYYISKKEKRVDELGEEYFKRRLVKKTTTSNRVNRFIKSSKYRLIETRHLTQKSYAYMKKTKTKVTKPYPLRNLYWDALAEGLDQKLNNVIVQKQHSVQLDLFDVGGYGCDFSQTDASACEVLKEID